jgi:hypothetical protein
MRIWKGRLSFFGVTYLLIALLTAYQLRGVVQSVSSVVTELVGIDHLERPMRREPSPQQSPPPTLLVHSFTSFTNESSNESLSIGTNAGARVGANRANGSNADSSLLGGVQLAKLHNNVSTNAAAKKTKAHAGRRKGKPKKRTATRKSSVKIVGPNSRSVNVTLVCQVRAELGNNLGHLAHCLGIQSQLAALHNLSSHLVVRNAGGKWQRARSDIHACFPRLSMHSFQKGNTNEFSVRRRQLNQTAFNVSGVSSDDPTEVDASLLRFANYTRHHSFRLPNPAISFPFLYADRMSFLDYVPDRYLDAIQEWFVFDHVKCCHLKPDPDESVFVRRSRDYAVSNHTQDYRH